MDSIDNAGYKKGSKGCQKYDHKYTCPAHDLHLLRCGILVQVALVDIARYA